MGGLAADVASEEVVIGRDGSLFPPHDEGIEEVNRVIMPYELGRMWPKVT